MASNETLETLIVKLQADVSGLQAQLTRSSNDVKAYATKSVTALGLVKTALGALGVGISFVALKRGFESIIAASAEHELSLKRLSSAFQLTGRTGGETMDRFVRLSEAIQATTRYSNDAAMSATALLAQLTHLDDDGLEKATKGAVGLAAVTGMDLNTAAMRIARTLSGTGNQLARYGVTIDKNTKGAERQKSVLDQLASMFVRAEDEAKTFAGTMSQLGTTWDDVKRALGDAIVKNPQVIQGIKDLKQGLTELIPKIEQYIKSAKFQDLMTDMGKVFDGFKDFVKFCIDNREIITFALIAAGVEKLIVSLKSLQIVIAANPLLLAAMSVGAAYGMKKEIEGLSPEQLRDMPGFKGSMYRSVTGGNLPSTLNYGISPPEQGNYGKEKNIGIDFGKHPAGKDIDTGTDIYAEAAARAELVLVKIKYCIGQLDDAYAQGELTAKSYYDSLRAEAVDASRITVEKLQSEIAAANAEGKTADAIAKKNEVKIEAINLQTRLDDIDEKQSDEARKKAEAREKIEDAAFAKKEADVKRTKHLLTQLEFDASEVKRTEEDRALGEFKHSLDERYQALVDAGLNEEQLARARVSMQILMEEETTKTQLAIVQKRLGIIQEAANLTNQIFSELYNAQLDKERAKVEMMRASGASEEAIKSEVAAAERGELGRLFRLQKAAAIAQSVINTAVAATAAYAQGGPYAGPFLAALVILLGGIQLGVIAGQSIPEFGKGGQVFGRRHKAGGVPATLEGGEFVQPVSSVDYYGAEVHEAMRQRIIPRSMFAGIHANMPSSYPSRIFGSGGMAGTSGTGSDGISIVNVIDPNLMNRFLNSPAGKSAVLNVLADRSYEVKRILATS